MKLSAYALDEADADAKTIAIVLAVSFIVGMHWFYAGVYVGPVRQAVEGLVPHPKILVLSGEAAIVDPQLDLGDEIPETLYLCIAQIIAFAYRLREQIGAAAWQAHLPVFELTTQHASLEEAFMQLTDDYTAAVEKALEEKTKEITTV